MEVNKCKHDFTEVYCNTDGTDQVVWCQNCGVVHVARWNHQFIETSEYQIGSKKPFITDDR